MFASGTRFTNGFYVGFMIDENSGDMIVAVEIKTDEGVTQVLNGEVVWDEG